ncbi:1-acyl-sn-glycerol-3-phosphate acyltransferase [Gallaecimonas sp. GXIMD1310]|uniref:1-acyl-sn-glycerol-3-phosphate acyltransferase n=1 Tax=Gallaecimonas sp. GXIMD1310 TaxID=3131926 RepID=UPI0032483402
MTQDCYAEIRPYHDDEVAAVIARLVATEEFADAIGRFEFAKLYPKLTWLLRPLVRQQLKRKLGGIDRVRDFQLLVADYMAAMISKTTDGVTVSGLEGLTPSKPMLFISNHRDIALDPAFVNYALHQAGHDTVRIAIGDNLLQKDYVSDLMRLNKSFIVKRATKAPRQLAANMGLLSAYIDDSLQQGHSIWIAQREGRAKDGNDVTDPALLKMLYMAHRKQLSFEQMVARLNIVPVAISYEYDPCDVLKARELAQQARGGSYEKAPFEDIRAIVQGITGQKGRVHVAFAEPLAATGLDSPAALASAIDQQIRRHYKLFPTNLAAAGTGNDWLRQRQQGLSADEAQLLKEAYARPVLNAQ